MKKWLFPIDKVNQQSGHNTTKETGNYAHGQHGFTQSGTINAHLHRLWDQTFGFFIQSVILFGYLNTLYDLKLSLSQEKNLFFWQNW